MSQPVCAHANLGPYTNVHFYEYSVSAAVEHFKGLLDKKYGSLEGIIDRTGEDYAPGLDLYYVSTDPFGSSAFGCQCNDQMNFHDYPSARWVIGNRGGVRKVYV